MFMDIDYLKISVRGSIVTDIIQVAAHHSITGGINAGCFSVPRQVFCTVDFLGAICYFDKGREKGASTRKAVRFIKEFFPRHYTPFANLIIAMWRHGTVHNFVPSEFFIRFQNKKIAIRWTSNRSDEQHNRIVNMKTFQKEKDANTIYLSVNICQLADDLLSAFDKFILKMETKPSFNHSCLRRLTNLLEIKNCMTSKKIGKNERNTLKGQILLAKSSARGEIDKNLQVKWYNNPSEKYKF